jgi:hypothetical protein
MKRIACCLIIGVVLGAGAAGLYAGVYSEDFSGVNLTVVGEYINAVPVPIANQQFAPKFNAGHTITGSIIYDPSQPDTDPNPNTGTYRIGTLIVNIPEIGLAASRASSSMQISAFNNTSNPDDQFFAYVNGVDTFLNSVGLPNPIAFDVLLFGNTSMLANDLLPTAMLNWNFGNVSFDFVAADNTTRQVWMTFSPVPEPTAFGLIIVGLLAVTAGRRCRPVR